MGQNTEYQPKIVENLRRISEFISHEADKIDKCPDKLAIKELLDQLQAIDLIYYDFCNDIDLEFNDNPGTSYRNGVSLEWEIETDLWHVVSKILRILNYSAINAMAQREIKS